MAPQRGQRAVPPGASGTSRWSRSQSWQACNRKACITRTIARADRQAQPAPRFPEPCYRFDIRSRAVGYRLVALAATRSLPPALGADVRELGAEEDDQRSIEHPHRHHDERARGTVGRPDARAPEIESDEALADGKERRGDEGAHPDVAP